MTTVALATVEIWRLFKKNPKQKLFGEKSSLLGSFVGDGILEVKSHDLSSAKCKPPVTETRAPPIGRAANIDRRADEWEDAKGGQRKVKPCPENLQPVVSLLCACVHLWSSVDFSDRPSPPANPRRVPRDVWRPDIASTRMRRERFVSVEPSLDGGFLLDNQKMCYTA